MKMENRYFGIDKMNYQKAKSFKKALKKMFGYSYPKVTRKSLEKKSRCRAVGEEWDTPVLEYGFFPTYINTREGAEEYFDEYIYACPFSMYDCSGNLFTWSFSIHENPNGRFSFVHRMHLDV